MKIIRYIIVLVVIAAGVVLAGWWYRSPKPSRVAVHEAKIADVVPMLKLCSVEIYDDVPIKGSIGSRHIFARAALNGSISFDLENVSMTDSGDTIRLTLPREIVEVYESTAPGSYLVIDTWNDNIFGSSKFSAAEENAVKRKVLDSYRRSIYRRGYVERARKEAVGNLTSMLSGLTGKTVIVTDPTPKGSM